MMALPDNRQPPAFARIPLADEAATQSLGRALGRRLAAGDVMALAGPLGVGKSSLARALIQSLTGEEEVPSPTFTLAQVYEGGEGMPALWHFDLYRLSDPREAYELGIEEAFSNAISLVEWPERLGALLPGKALWVEMQFAGGGGRAVSLRGKAGWARRLAGLALDP
ncbi:MAG: tRNA (adenosine(37)-N6)-threonylcarbamoyltransferase complex ATPase subunit type 1 TsaE [Pseudomonadota bacterium]|jgi:tRNA threonylcarbamoyladenosine biosynthesis protein TsaE